ncbi:MAG: phospholipase [Myxococcota bacterium]|nr:phospholipase [Myxococcota bacterium]
MEAVGRLGPALLGVLVAFERIQRELDPENFQRLSKGLAEPAARLSKAFDDAAARPRSPETERLGAALLEAARHGVAATELFLGTPKTETPAASGAPVDISRVMGALREHCRAQAGLFPLRGALPPLDRYFIEPQAESRLGELRAGRPGTGIFNASNGPEVRGGFSFFAPEDYDEAKSWPLVVALHGGWGHGGDFLWTWLREARSRGWLLLAPTSQATTWSMMGADSDAAALDSMLDYVEQRWNVASESRLLTGLSDGGTYALLRGLAEGSRFTALAPVACVLHPANLVNGNLGRARGKPIRWIHGARDWMFPLEVARQGCSTLKEAGAETDLIEIADLAHAYPREQNPGILEWAGTTR